MSGKKTRDNESREILKFLQTVQLKYSKQAKKAAGFTLIELLVGLILAFLIIAPLLGFVVNMMNTDRQEQAKSTSEQELQVAADYITRDLQQAVYIYDADGVAVIKAQLPKLPDDSNGDPVLVFWKRKFIPNAISKDGTSQCTIKTDCNDAFVYALVAYYLTTVKTPNVTTSTWSGAAQIRRVEIQDCVKGSAIDSTGNTLCINEKDPQIGRDTGFSLNLSTLKGNSLAQKMNSWTVTQPITRNPDVLVDYIDPTSTSDTSNPCPPDDPTYKNLYPTDPQWQLITRNVQGFYACVFASRNTAQVFLRGNALARISPKNNVPPYNSSKSSFFPTARIEVTGSGGLGNFK